MVLGMEVRKRSDSTQRSNSEQGRECQRDGEPKQKKHTSYHKSRTCARRHRCLERARAECSRLCGGLSRLDVQKSPEAEGASFDSRYCYLLTSTAQICDTVVRGHRPAKRSSNLASTTLAIANYFFCLQQPSVLSSLRGSSLICNRMTPAPDCRASSVWKYLGIVTVSY